MPRHQRKPLWLKDIHSAFRQPELIESLQFNELDTLYQGSSVFLMLLVTFKYHSKTRQEPDKKIQIFLKVFNKIKSKLYRLSQEKQNIILKARDSYDSCLLGQAVFLKNDTVFNCVFSLFQDETHHDALTYNLNNVDNRYIGVLQHALVSHSEHMFDTVWQALTQNPEALKLNLAFFTCDGFGVLQSAMKSGSKHMFRVVWQALKQNPEALKLNLENFTRDDFGVLQSALNTGSELMCRTVWQVLIEKENQSALKLNLEKFTRDGFGVLQSTLNFGSEPLFNMVWQALRENQKALKLNLEKVTHNGFGVLQCALYTGSEPMFDTVWQALIKNPHALKLNLETFTHDGFGVLQSALNAGSASIFHKVWQALTQNREALKLNLESVTRAGFGVLQTALKSGSEPMFDTLWQALRENQRILKLNLEGFTHNRFGVLQTALKSGSEHMFDTVWQVLIEKENQRALKLNLEGFTRDGFGVLQTALNSGSEHMFRTVWQVLIEKENQRALKLNLEGFTRDGFGVLQTALNSGSEPMFHTVWQTLIENPRAFKLNLENVTNDGFGVLQLALKSDSKLMFQTVWQALIKNPQALKLNLENVTKNGFGVLQHALNSDSELIFQTVWQALIKNPQALNSSLENVTNDGFGVLQQAIIQGSETMFEAVWRTITKREHQSALHKNLITFNHFGYSLLSSVITNGSDDMVNKVIVLSQEKLNKIEWRRILLSRKNVFLDAIHSHRPSLTKIKLILTAFHDAFGDNAYENIRRLTGNKDFIMHGKTFTWDDLIADGPYLLPSIKQLIKEREQRRPNELNIAELLATRDFSFSELRVHDQYKSLLWFAACEAAFDKPQAFLTIWQKHQTSFRESDFCQRSDRGSANKSVLWFLLYAATKNSDFVTIINTIWQRFPNAFELNYTPIREPESRSVQNLLLKLGETGKDILYELGVFSEEIAPEYTSINEIISEPCTLNETLEQPDEVYPTAGIGDKYLGGALPKYNFLSEGKTLQTTIYRSTYTLSQPCQHDRIKSSSRIPFEINRSGFKAVYYSQQGMPRKTQERQTTFICAGRGTQAFVPKTTQGSVVWVITEKQNQELHRNIPSQHDILVVKEINSRVSGNFDNLGLITSRRLAIFLFARHCNLEHFIMMDDNIKQIILNQDNLDTTCDWHDIYHTLKKDQGDFACTSVKTLTHKPSQSGELGSKLFLINLAKIRTRLENFEELALLLPCAKEARKWGEDYYFQIMLHQLFSNHGYRIVNSDIISLIRSKKNQNAFAATLKTTGKVLVETFEPPSATNLEPDIINCLIETITILNNIINANSKRYQKQKEHLARDNLLAKHAQLNHTVSNATKLPTIKEQSLKTTVAELTFLDDVHYPHQKEAIRSLAHLKQNSARILMATGTGKTRIQCELARLMYHHSKPGVPIIIVTPQISLVNQFYQDFKNFANLQTTTDDYSIPESAIVKITSGLGAICVEKLMTNKTILRQRSILIFCEKSFQKYLPTLKNKAGLILLDEYHEYSSTVEKISQLNNKHLVLGFTASPPEHDHLGQTLYNYTLTQALYDGRVAPVLIDALKLSYSTEAVKQLIENLPDFLNSHYHPGVANIDTDNKYNGKTLAQTKGVIYLPSAEMCDLAHQVLQKANIASAVVNSKNNDNHTKLSQFKQQHSGILLAQKMLRVGFDDHTLGWEIIAQNPSSDAVLLQLVGRVLRLCQNKVGYVITFSDLKDKITNVLRHNEQLNMKNVCVNYLAQESSFLAQPVLQIAIEIDNSNDEKFNEFLQQMNSVGYYKSISNIRENKKRKLEEKIEPPAKKQKHY